MKLKISLIRKIFLYLIIFSVAILSFLWLFQVAFLSTYYDFVKNKDMDKIASKITESYLEEDFEETLDYLTFEKDVCILIISDEEKEYASYGVSTSCLTNRETNFIYEKYTTDFINSNKTEAEYKLIDSKYNSQILVKCIKLDDGKFVFITTLLEPIGSTTSILTSQLIIVTIIVLFLALWLAYFISRKISSPIIKINKNAKKMSNGEFNIDFKTDSNIKEIVELSETLNKALEELSKTDEIRRELMANISHDLKTPLTMIKAYSEMVRDLTYNDEEKRNANLNTIIEETDRLNLLVNDILELSKVQSSVVGINIESFDMNETIKNIIKRLDCFKEQKNYKFIYENKKELIVLADKKEIEKVIYNLLSNAINYVGNDLQVIVKVTEKKDTYLVEVTDHGKGIKQADIELIWDKYYRTDKNHKRSDIGTGLGLSIVKGILVKHSFDYGVSSKLGKGTTFYFEINKNK